jgi:hypothetical protein
LSHGASIFCNARGQRKKIQKRYYKRLQSSDLKTSIVAGANAELRAVHGMRYTAANFHHNHKLINQEMIYVTP